MQNHFNKNFFSDQIDFENFQLLLTSLNHVKPVYISRKRYQFLQGNILKPVGKDELGDIFELFLPKDLKSSELLSLTLLLTNKFHLQEYAHLEKLVTKVKLLVELITRDLSPEEKSVFLGKIQRECNIDKKTFMRVYSQKMLFGVARETLKTLDRKSLSKEELFLEILTTLESEFHLTFFRKGVNMLRIGMMTITSAEIGPIQKKDGDIEVRIPARQLDKREGILRDKIGIDKLKSELETARLTGKQKIIESVEKKAVNKILCVLFEYPYQVTPENNGFQPSKILQYKEIYCTGFSILGHAFLTELGIEHYGLSLDEHTALEVVIGGKRYYFDATMSDALGTLEVLERDGLYEIMKASNSDDESFYTLSYDAEKTLLSHILFNLGTSFSLEGKNQEAIKFFQKAILLNPVCAGLYKSLADEYHHLNQNNIACEIIQDAISLNPFDGDNFNNYGVYLAQSKRYQEAITQYNNSLLRNKKNLEAYLNMSTSYFHLGDHERALLCAKKAGQIGGMTPEVYNAVGLACIKGGKIQEAIQAFRRCIQEAPMDSYYYNNMGLALEEGGNVKLGRLFEFASDMIDNVSKRKRFSPEEKEVRAFLEDKNFLGLGKYLLESIEN